MKVMAMQGSAMEPVLIGDGPHALATCIVSTDTEWRITKERVVETPATGSRSMESTNNDGYGS